ncbi:hypothetical protein BSKO_07627 [Bryopsis sp. KO-2023]|nr:hypothetical protein BSKO_07627 [Bryopsis sp. KO-2023]
MQPGNVYRPVFVAGERGATDAAEPSTTTVMSSAELPRLHVNVQPPQLPSAASSFPQQGVMYPDIAVFGQLDQAVPRMALLHPLQMHAPQPPPPAAQQPVSAPPTERRAPAKTKSQSDYASRHQAAEQRRRTRINERLERLRTIVPHAERTNTATFLEQVFTHIENLNAKVVELKTEVGTRDRRICEILGEPIPEPEKQKAGEDEQQKNDELFKEDGIVEGPGVYVTRSTISSASNDFWTGGDSRKRVGEHLKDSAKRLRSSD